MHVHDNVTSARGASETDTWVDRGRTVAEEIQKLLGQYHGCGWTVLVRHVEPVKSYAPHVMHVVSVRRGAPLTMQVFDLECRPSVADIHK